MQILLPRSHRIRTTKFRSRSRFEGRPNHAKQPPRRKLTSVELIKRMSPPPSKTQTRQTDNQKRAGQVRFVEDVARRSSRRIPTKDVDDDEAEEAKEARLQARRRTGSTRHDAIIMSLNNKIQSNARTRIKIKPTQSKPIRPPNGHLEPYASSNWFVETLLLFSVSILLLATCSTATNQLKAQLVTVSSSVSHWSGSNGAANVSVSSHNGALNSVRGRRVKRSRTQPTGARGLRPPPSSSKPSNRQQSEAESLAQQQHHAAGRSIRNVTAQNGQDVLLHCLVEANAAGDFPQVSWFRGSSEPQLLTYDTTTIIMDERFLVRQGIARPNDWALQIKRLNKSQDAGLYHCQTDGESGQLQSYQLNIVEPQVDILGAPDLTVRVGSPVNLTCVISHSADEPQFVFWYRDRRMINYDDLEQTRSKIVLSKWSQQRDSITSNLQIFQSRPTDSGNYTCAPSGARSSSIQVHVLQATDKRLMMFQQDESNALAASSQQTNSAISQHVIRLSRGRAYAFLVGLFILATWFQLIAQLQTLVSLFLIAIIGLLLGQRNSRHHGQHRDGRRKTSLSAEDAVHEKLAIGHKQDEELLKSSGSPQTASSFRRQSSRTSEDDHKLEQTTNRGSDQLLRGAEEALSLLKTLHVDDEDEEEDERALSCSSSVEFGDQDETKFRSLSFGALDEGHRFGKTPPERRRRRRVPASSQPKEPLTIEGPMLMSDIANNNNDNDIEQQEAKPSPSSSSCSPNSTGYNSDSTRRCSSSAGGNCTQTTPTTVPAPHPARRWTPNVSLLDERPSRADEGASEGEIELLPESSVIELIKGRPTAMRLIIEQLQRTGELAPDWTSSMGRASCGRRTRDEPLYASPATSKRNPISSRNNNNDDDDCRPLDLSQSELAKRSASATFQRPD